MTKAREVEDDDSDDGDDDHDDDDDGDDDNRDRGMMEFSCTCVCVCVCVRADILNTGRKEWMSAHRQTHRRMPATTMVIHAIMKPCNAEETPHTESPDTGFRYRGQSEKVGRGRREGGEETGGRGGGGINTRQKWNERSSTEKGRGVIKKQKSWTGGGYCE